MTADADRADHEPLARQAQVRAVGGVGGRTGPARRDQPHRLVVQPPQREREHLAASWCPATGRRPRRAAAARTGERAQHAQHGDADDPVARRAVAASDSSSAADSALAGRRAARPARAAVQPVEQVAQPGEGQAASDWLHRQSGRRPGRPGLQHAAPDRGLADARRAPERSDAGPSRMSATNRPTAISSSSASYDGLRRARMASPLRSTSLPTSLSGAVGSTRPQPRIHQSCVRQPCA